MPAIVVLRAVMVVFGLLAFFPSSGPDVRVHGGSVLRSCGGDCVANARVKRTEMRRTASTVQSGSQANPDDGCVPTIVTTPSLTVTRLAPLSHPATPVVAPIASSRLERPPKAA